MKKLLSLLLSVSFINIVAKEIAVTSSPAQVKSETKQAEQTISRFNSATTRIKDGCSNVIASWAAKKAEIIYGATLVLAFADGYKSKCTRCPNARYNKINAGFPAAVALNSCILGSDIYKNGLTSSNTTQIAASALCYYLGHTAGKFAKETKRAIYNQ